MKLGSDVVGTAMGLLTIPMALLSVGSVAAGLTLAIRQAWSPVVFGLAVFLLCSILARLVEWLVIRIDDAAALSLGKGRRRHAHLAAIISGALPVAVILAAEVACLRGVIAHAAGAPAFLGWLWGYGAATGPWTLFAERVSRFRRTLVGIRAYAGHVALWLYSLLALWLDASPVAVGAAMLVPAALPFAVGLLLALADRDAITNVRV